MKYIIHKRFKSKAISGDINLPAMTECESDGTFIVYNGNAICCITSRNAHQHFASNDDGMGMLRGKLTRAIQDVLSQNDDDHQTRWNKIWGDPICQSYKRSDHADHWLWNHEFYSADIITLKYIARLVGIDPNKYE